MSNHLKNPIVLYYIANWFTRQHIPFVGSFLQSILFFLFGATIPRRAEIGSGCLLAHGGNGIVIHPKARIGKNVYISQQVTIGGSGVGTDLPVIGDDVYIGTGAKILGPITVGANSVIGANAVVVKSVPAHCVAAGVPARILRENINAHDVEMWA
jgi:serine O-acetyltransferase